MYHVRIRPISEIKIVDETRYLRTSPNEQGRFFEAVPNDDCLWEDFALATLAGEHWCQMFSGTTEAKRFDLIMVATQGSPMCNKCGHDLPEGRCGGCGLDEQDCCCDPLDVVGPDPMVNYDDDDVDIDAIEADACAHGEDTP